jgi:hypothetical protein
MIELTAVQKIRQQLTGNPYGEPLFEHEGPDVVRWITGGNQPDLHVFFESQPESDLIFVRCSTCQLLLGYMSKDDQAYALDEMRQSGHEHH